MDDKMACVRLWIVFSWPYHQHGKSHAGGSDQHTGSKAPCHSRTWLHSMHDVVNEVHRRFRMGPPRFPSAQGITQVFGETVLSDLKVFIFTVVHFLFV